MRALIYAGKGRIELVDIEEPVLRASNDVKVRIAMTGICGTDHKILAGKLAVAEKGTVLGHEGVGTVVEVGDSVTHLKVGDRVIINPTQSCGTCRNCRLGAYCYCFNFDDHQVGFTLAGTFAEYFVGKAQYLYPIPDGMSWQVASLIEPLGCSLNSVLKSNLQPHESVLVIGSGAIGLLCQSITRRLKPADCGDRAERVSPRVRSPASPTTRCTPTSSPRRPSRTSRAVKSSTW